MARPKGSTNKAKEAQGVEIAKKETPIEAVKEEKTTIVTAKASPAPKKELQKGGGYLAIVNGEEVYWSRVLLDTSFKRDSHTIEIPKGSNYTPPVGSKCENCG